MIWLIHWLGQSPHNYFPKPPLASNPDPNTWAFRGHLWSIRGLWTFLSEALGIVMEGRCLASSACKGRVARIRYHLRWRGLSQKGSFLCRRGNGILKDDPTWPLGLTWGTLIFGYFLRRCHCFLVGVATCLAHLSLKCELERKFLSPLPQHTELCVHFRLWKETRKTPASSVLSFLVFASFQPLAPAG